MKNPEIYRKLKSSFSLRVRDELVECRKPEKYAWVEQYLKNLAKKKLPLHSDIVASSTNSI